MTQTTSNRTARHVLAAVALSLVGAAAVAAPVIWSGPSAITGDADVNTNGTLVMAYNLGSQVDATVNGVTFKAFFVDAAPTFPADHVKTVGDATLALRNRERDTNVLENGDRFTSLGPFASLSTGYQALLRSSAYNNFPDRFDNPAVLTLAGLVVGQTYEIQTWFNDSKGAGCCAFGLGVWDVADSDNKQFLAPNLLRDNSGDVVEGGLGQHVLGTFTAESSTKQFGFMRTEIGGGLNAFQLRQRAANNTVPLPGSLPLVLAALLAGALTVGSRRLR